MSAVAGLAVLWAVLLVALGAFVATGDERRRRQTGAFARAALPAVLVPLALMASQALQQAGAVQRTSADLSGNERNTVAPQTEAVLDDLRRLDARVTITGFFPADRSRWRATARALRRYQERSGRVRTRFVDPDQQPALARRYEVQAPGDVYVDLRAPGLPGEGRRVRSDSASEADVTTAIVRSLNGERTLCWSLGHGERPASQDPTLQTAAGRLETNGFAVREGSLAGGAGFLDGCSAVVVASPRAAPLPDEAALLDQFLTAGGRLLLLLDPDDAGDDVARAWGAIAAVDPVGGEVVDPEGGVAREPRALVADRFPSSSPITEKLPSVFFLGARALDPPPDDPGRGLTSSPLVTASEAARAGEREAPALAVALDVSRTVGDGQESRVVRTRVAAFGDADWLQNEAIRLLGNEAMFVRTVNWLVQAPTLVAIPSRLVAENLLLLTASDRRRVDLGVFLLPALAVSVLAAGRWSLTLRRRRRDPAGPACPPGGGSTA